MISINTSIEIEKDNEHKENFIVDNSLVMHMKEILKLTLVKEGISQEALVSDKVNIEVSVSVVEKEEIRLINKEFRNIDRATDVLSFPQYDNFEGLKSCVEERMIENCMDMPLIIGDVIICYDIVREQAKEFGHTLEREFLYLFTHSIYHLLGYDHIDENEKIQMRKKEEEIMSIIGVAR